MPINQTVPPSEHAYTGLLRDCTSATHVDRNTDLNPDEERVHEGEKLGRILVLVLQKLRNTKHVNDQLKAHAFRTITGIYVCINNQLHKNYT